MKTTLYKILAKRPCAEGPVGMLIRLRKVCRGACPQPVGVVEIL